jgi:RNA polymerase sigma factor for flagellar operon FliA
MPPPAGQIDLGDGVAAPTTSTYESLILGHGDLVRRIARYMARRLPGQVELDDLEQAGMVGLLEAAQRYADREDACFATYATHRIRGAMLDFLRATDWSPRSLRRRMRDIEAAHQRLDACDAPRPRAIAKALGMTLDAYHRTLRDSSFALMISLDQETSAAGAEFFEPIDQSPRPDEELEYEQALHALTAAIDALPESDHTVLRLYYEQEYLLRDIAAVLALTESRVCQIHKRIIEQLRIVTRRNPSNKRLRPPATFPRRPYRSRALPARAPCG